ncbi:MAG: HD domain-containing phosphohydrolase [Chloroflexota bacterium]
MLLILLAVLPMVFAAGFFAFNWGLNSYRNLENQTQLLVNSIAERQIWSIENAQIVISELSTRVDRWFPLQLSECKRLLNEYIIRGGFVSLAILDESGRAICTVPDVDSIGDVGEISDLINFSGQESFTIGSLQQDAISERLVIPIVFSMNGNGKKTAGLIYAAFPVEIIQQTIIRSGTPQNSETVLTDRNGNIIASLPEYSNLIGSEDPVLKEIIENGGLSNQGKFTSDGIDGISRLFSYREISVNREAFAIVRSGLPLESVNREFQKLFYSIAFLYGAVFLFSILLAYLISGRVLEQRSEPLLDAAKKIARGDLAVRTRPRTKESADGLLELEKTFNQMAEALEKREKSHRQIEEALKESNEKLAAIIRTSPLAIVVENMEGRVIEWSPAASSIFGWTASETIGKKLPIISSDHGTYFDSIRKRILEGKTIQIQEIKCQTKDQREIPVGLSAALLKSTTGEAAGITYLFADLSEQKKALEAINETQQTLAVLLNNLPGMAYRYSLAEKRITFISPGCMELTGFTPDELLEDNKIHFQKIIHPDDWNNVKKILEETATSGKSYRIIYRIRTSNHQVRWVLEQGVGIVNNGGSVCSIEGYITDISEVKKREREMEVIASISAVMRSARGKTEISNIVLDQIARHLDAEGGAIAFREPTGLSVVEIAIGILRPIQGYRYNRGEGLIGRVIESGLPVLGDGISFDSSLSIPDIENRANAVLCVPLLEREQAMGSILIVRESSFSQDDLRLVTSISDMVATAIRRITLYEQTEKRLQQLVALRTIETAITSSLDFRFTLSILLDQVVSQLNVDAADVWLYDAKSQRLVFVAGWGFRSLEIRTSPAPVGWGLPGKVAQQRSPIFVPSFSDWEGEKEHVIPLEREGLNSYYGTPIIAKGQLHGVLEVFQRHTLRLDAEKREFLNSLISGAAIAIDNARMVEDLQKTNRELAAAYDQTILGWSMALEMRDAETEGHTRRVAEATVKLAREMGLSEAELVNIWRGAVLHDIGKMAVPDTILLKKGELTTEDWKILRKHPLYAQSMLSGIEFLQPALDIPTFHHEHWDGNGYPLGLKGEQIPLPARIFAVVDVWDALRYDRHYRARWKEEDVIDYISGLSGKQFDPKVVEVFLKMLKEGKL